MDKTQMGKMLEEQRYEELIELLEEEEYEELTMLTLCKAYLLSGDGKKAKKVLRKLKMLFPMGQYADEEERIADAIENGAVAEYLSGIQTAVSVTGIEQMTEEELPTVTGSEGKAEKQLHRAQAVSLVEYASKKRRKKKKERVVPDTIKAYFEDVVGLEGVQLELDTFYKKLRLQNERKQNDFNADIIDSTHFAVLGAIGCGKTLVGEIIGGLLYDFGVRANESTVRVRASELKAAYMADNESGMAELFEQIDDSTIIIEDIDTWFTEAGRGDETGDFIRGFTTFLYSKRQDLSFVLTGSKDAFTKAEEKSISITDAIHKIIEIPDYSTIELCEITKILADRKDLVIHETAQKALMQKIDMERLNPDFMNAITLQRYINQATDKMAIRYGESHESTDAMLVSLMPEDFEIEIEEEENMEELLQQLEDLTGLHAVKEQIKKRIQAVITAEQAEEAGAKRKDGHGSLHMIFVGNPGTGKTTVARIVGKIYQRLGILPRGNQVVEVTRSGLVGEYVGSTAKNVQRCVKQAMGGVLFIDEAYALCRDDGDSFGHEAVDELIAQIENNKDSMMVILAGYKKEMADFLKTNPGFSSRIRTTIDFEDYNTEEMAEIFSYMVAKDEMRLEEDAKEAVLGMIEERAKTPDFGNARGVRNLFEEVKEAMNQRIQEMLQSGERLTKDDYEIIVKADIEVVAGGAAAKEKSLDELLDELNGLTGLVSVKEKVQEMVDAVLVREYMKSQAVDLGSRQETMHLVFKGNAGTGKTTVARLLGDIYKKLGVLQKNVVIEATRKDFVAQYTGQTAAKTSKLIESADGGILFIDEAYALIDGVHDEFGREAINTLVPELENRRDTLMVILAGYETDMNRFLDANQGLASRLSNTIVFEDYTDEELVDIFKYQAKKKGLHLQEGMDEVILEKIQTEKGRVKDFGNARGVRNILEAVSKKKDSRIAAVIRRDGYIAVEDARTLLPEDFQ